VATPIFQPFLSIVFTFKGTQDYRQVCSATDRFAVTRGGHVERTHRQLVARRSVAAMSAPLTRSTDQGQDYSDVETMFERLASAETEDERRRWRCQIVSRCLPLADHIAYRFVGRGEPGEDLMQVARLGLVKAVDRYRLGSGHFLSFAVPTILGDVRRHFRDNTWAMHVPRRVKENHRRVRAAIDPLSQRLGRAPNATELAAELDLSVDDVMTSLQAAYAYRPASLDATANADPDEGPPALGTRNGADDGRFERIEDALTVAGMVAQLSERERAIVSMRFGECLSQTQIAARLGISQVHVSRLLGITLERLRNAFEDGSVPA
jgi:RNA polymerase sigma-B factor